MKKRILLLIISTGLLLGLPAQKDRLEQIRHWHREATRLYNLSEPTTRTDSTALSLFLKTGAYAAAEDYPLAIDCYIKAGNIHQGYQRFADANILYHQAIDLNNKHVRKSAIAYEAYLYLGSSYYFSNVIDSAQHYFEAASDIAMVSADKESLTELERLYNSLGAIYFESANYQQAKNYFEKALEVANPDAEDFNNVFTGIRSNIANCLMKLNQYDSALRILKSLEPEKNQEELIRQNTAHCFFELKKYDSALNIYKNLELQSGYQSVVALTDMGRIYMQNRQWQKAEVVLDSAIARNKAISRTLKNKEEALAYLYRSQLAQAQGLTDEAITWINEALQEVHLDFNWKKLEDLPADIGQSVSPITLFAILHEKARLMQFKHLKTAQTDYLVASLACYRKAIETANFIKLNFDNDEAKLFFNENYWSIYQEAVEGCATAINGDLNFADDYIFIVENYKGNILYQNIRDVLFKSSIDLPDSIRNREQSLKQLLAVYTARINQSSGEEDAAQLRKKILSLQVELSRIQKIYEQDEVYSLYKFQQHANRQTLRTIQQSLPKNTAVLNFFYGDSAIFCLGISKHRWSFRKLAKDSLFEASYQVFTREVYQYEEGKRYEGMRASQVLYDYLVKPMEDLAGDFSNWVILPDGALYKLPFEALMPDAKKKEYLIQRKTISYHYSYALLLDQDRVKKENPAPQGLIGFAPFQEADLAIRESGLPALPFSAEEVSTWANKFFAGARATKTNFLSAATSGSMLHLATHASLGRDSNQNWIQFYPGDSLEMNQKLYLAEIYNLNLRNLDLVVLSACETGGGAAASGEGLLSLSRAFMYAGVGGVVSTLWKTEDRVTAFLMKRMHFHLSGDASVERALQLAKIDLINTTELGTQYKMPNYWAGFVYSGKLAQGENRASNWYWWAAGAALVLLFFFWILRQRKRPHHF